GEVRANQILARTNRDLEANLYLHQIQLVSHELTNVAIPYIGRARELLENCPPPLREWEWHYLNRLLSGNPHRTLGGPGSARPMCLAFSSDGHSLACARDDGTVTIWDPSGGRALSTFRAHVGAVRGIAFGPDDRHLVSAGDDHTVKVWEYPPG